MRLKFLILSFALILVLSACTKKEDQPQQKAQINSNVHQVIIQEAIQVSGYTYVRVKEGDKEYWMAATTMEAKQGDTFFYETAMEMKNFESKELKRTFDSIMFVDNLSKIPPASAAPGTKAAPQKPTIEKQDVSVAPAAGGVTIAQLFSNVNMYANKLVKIKGKVVKVNNGIMSKNWAHIQDGTSSGKDFDLTVTSNEMVNIGDIVTFTGKIALNKDFGFGYSYKVLLEDAKVTK